MFKTPKKGGGVCIAGGSDVGKVRRNNQDSFYKGELTDKIKLAIVADGMGGYKGGDVASQLCVNTVVSVINTKYEKNADIEELLCESIDIANTAVYDRANESEYLKGMGTTIVMAAFADGMAYVFNVGDSRAYHVSADYKVKQITTDHTLVQEYVNMGKITQDQAKSHNYRHVITRAIGTDKSVQIDVFKFPIIKGESILLCSDGMYEYIDNDTLEYVLKNADDSEDAIKTLIDKSNELGGTDNITVVIASLNESE